MSTPIFLIQLLCPSRHAIVATLFEADVNAQLEALQRLDDQRQTRKLNSWCGICGSSDLKYEVRPTKFASLTDAFAAMSMLDAENIQTRRELDAAGLTYDSRREVR